MVFDFLKKGRSVRPSRATHSKKLSRILDPIEALESRLAPAAVYTWTGSSSNDWLTAGNWSLTSGADTGGAAGVPDFAGESVVFSGSVVNNQPNLTSAATVDSISVTSGTYTINGSNLTVPTVDVASPGTLTINNTITGGSGLIKSGNGVLTVAGDNSYTGATSINNGTFRISTNSANLVAKYEFEGNTNDTSGNGLNGTINGAGTSYTAGQFGQAINFTGSQYVQVPFNAALGMNSYTISAWVNLNAAPGVYGIVGTRIGGDTTFDYKVQATNIHGDVGSGTAWINTGVDFNQVVPTGSWHMITYVIDDAAKNFRLYYDGALKSTIGYAGTPLFMKAGQTLAIGSTTGGELMNGKIDDVNIFSRPLSTVEVGRLFTGANAIPDASAVTVASGATLDVNGKYETIGSLSGVAGSAVTLTGGLTAGGDGSTTTFAGTMGGTGALTKAGGGTMILSGTGVTHTGATTISAGTLQLNDTTAFVSPVVDNAALAINRTSGTQTFSAISGTGSVSSIGNTALVFQGPGVTYTGATTIGAGTLELKDIGVFSSSTISIGSTLTLNQASGTSTVNSVITGAATLTKIGAGTVVLGATGNSYGGPTQINVGTLRVGNTGGLVARYAFEGNTNDTSGNGLNGTINGAGTSYTAGQFGQAINFTGSQYVQVPFNAAFGLNSYTVSAWVNLNAAAGTYGIVGTRIGGDTTFDYKVQATNIHGDVGSGTAWINTGVDFNQVVPTGSWHMITYVIDDVAKVFRLYYDGVLKNTIGYTGTPLFMKAGQTLAIGSTTGGELMNGKIDDVQIIGRALSTTEVGNLLIGGGDAIPDGSAVTVASGATLDLADHGETIGSISGVAGSNLTLGTATLVTGGNGGTTSFAGSVAGSGGITKAGGGTFTLSGAGIASTGTTTVNGGILQLDDATSFAGPIIDNATLNINRTTGSQTFAGGISGSGNVSLIGAGAVVFQGSLTYTGTTNINAGSLELNNISTFNSTTVNNATSLLLNQTAGSGAVNSAIAGVGTVTKIGAGTVTLGGGSGNTYGGLTTISDGTLILAKTSGNAISGNVVVGDADAAVETLQLGGNNQIADSATLTVNNNGVFAMGSFSDTVAVLAGNGSITSPTFTGTFGLIPQTFFTNDAGTGIASTKTYTHALDFNPGGSGGGNVATVNGVAFTGAATSGTAGGYGWNLNVAGSAANTATGATGGISTLLEDFWYNATATNPSTLVLSNLTPGAVYEARLYSRIWGGPRNESITFDAGGGPSTPYAFDQDAAGGPNYVGYRYQAVGTTMTININAVTLGTNFHWYGMTNELLGGSLTVGDGTSQTFSGSISGSVGLIKQGSGQLALQGAGIAHTGLTTVNAGTLRLDDATSFASAIVNSATTNINRTTGTQTLAAGISGAGTVNIIGAGTVVFQGPSFVQTGTTNVNAGTLELRDVTAFAGPVNVGAALTLNQTTGTSTVSSAISGVGTVTKIGPGTITLAGTSANTYAGLTTVSDGTLGLSKTGVNAIPGNIVVGDADAAVETLLMAGSNQIADGATLTINNNGVFSLGSFSETIAVLAGNGSITSPSFTGTLGLIPQTFFTNDAGTGIASTKTYTHALDFNPGGSGGGNVATVNGVAFTGAATSGTAGGYGWNLNVAGSAANTATGATGGISTLLEDFWYNTTATNPSTLVLSNLTPGAVYEARLYSRIWGGPRNESITFDAGGGPSTPYAFDQDAAGGPNYVGYRYQAVGTTMTININAVAPGTNFHWYGMTNELLGGTLTVGDSTSQTYSGSITGGISLVKQGSGQLALQGSGIAHTGSTTVTAGTLRLDDATAFVSPIANNATVSINRTTGTQTLASSISGTGTVNIVGPGAVVFQGAGFTYTGTTNINAGTLELNNIGLFASATVNDATTLILNPTSGPQTVASNIAGVGGITHIGSNATTLTGNNTYGGATLVNSGTLKVGGGAVGASVAHYAFDGNPNDTSGNGRNGVIVGAGTSYVAGQFGQAINFTGTQQVQVPFNAAFGLNSYTVSAWVNLNAAPGTYGIVGTRIGGDTTFDYKVQAGSIHGDVGNGSAWINTAVDFTQTVPVGSWHMITYVIDNGAQEFRLYYDGVLKNTIGFTGTPLFMKAGQTLAIGSTTGGELMNGAIDDVYIIGSALSNAQVLALMSPPASNGISDASNVTVASGATLDVSGFAETVGSLAGVAGANVVLSGAAGQGTLNAGANGASTTFAGSMTGTGNLTKSGAGTFELTGSGINYTGATTVSAGTLQFTNISGFVSPITDNANVTINQTAGSSTFTSIVGTGTVTKIGAAAAVLQGPGLTYSGATNINVGSLELNAITAFASPINNAATLILNQPSGSSTVTSAISGAGVVNKVGAGTVVLAGSSGNTYSGLTTVSDGTLTLNKTTGNAIGGNLLIGDADPAVETVLLAASNQVADTSTVTIASNGVFNTNGFSDTIAALAGNGTIASPSFTGTFGLIPQTFFTNDAGTGIASTKTYTHALDFNPGGSGGGNVATVNGVAFTGAATSGAAGGYGWNLNVAGSAANTATGATGGISTLLEDFWYNATASNPSTLVLSNLTPGVVYEARLYSRIWGGPRNQSITFDSGGGPSTPYVFDQDAAGGPSYVGYRYLAVGTTMTINITAVAPGTNFHWYGMTNELLGGGTLTVGDATSQTFSGAITGSLSLVKQGTGQLALQGPNIAHTGTTTISNGTLRLDDATGYASAITDNAALTINRTTGSQTFGSIVGTGTAAVVGAGAVVFSGAGVTYSGATTVSAGSLELNNATAFVSNVVDNASLILNQASGSISYNVAISGSGTVAKIGAGTVTLGGSTGNTYTGLTAVSEGTLLLAKSSGNAIGGDLTIGDADVAVETVRLIANNQIADTSTVTVNSTGVFDMNLFSDAIGGLNGVGSVIVPQLSYTYGLVPQTFFTTDATTGISASKTYTHLLDWAASVAGSGAGTVNGVAFTNAGYTGPNWTLVGSPGTAADDATGMTDNGGMRAILQDFYHGSATAQLTLSGLTPGVSYETRVYIRQWAGGAAIRTQNITYDEDGPGPGGATLSNFNEDGSATPSFIGYRFVAATSSMVINIAQAVGSTGPWHWYGLSNEVLPTGNSALTFAGSGSYSFTGIISGSGTVTMQGTGVQSLGGPNSYTGTTTVNQGTLRIDGSIVNGPAVTDVTVNNGGILGGSGIVGGTVQVNSGGAVAPGNSAGSLTTSSTNFASGSTFNVKVVGNNADQLNVSGTVALNNAKLVVDPASTPIAAHAPYTIINNDGSDPISGNFTTPLGAALPEGAEVGTFGGVKLYITYNADALGDNNGNDVQLTTNPVVNGTAGNDTLVVRQKNATQIEYSFNGGAFTAIDSSLLLTFNGVGGTDQMLVDLSPSFTFNGNVQFSGESLRVQGAGAGTALYTPAGTNKILAGSGFINFTGPTPTVDFVNLADAGVQVPTGAFTFTAGNTTAVPSVIYPAGYTFASQPTLTTSGAAVVNFAGNAITRVDTGFNAGDTITIGVSGVTVAGTIELTGVTIGGPGVLTATTIDANAMNGITLSTNTVNLSAQTFASTANIVITETSAINLDDIETFGGSVAISAGGDINVSYVAALNSSVALQVTAANGSILDRDNDPDADIEAPYGITLIAKGTGTIGASTNALELGAYGVDIIDGLVGQTDNQNIYLSVPLGDVRIQKLNAVTGGGLAPAGTSGDITLSGAGNIFMDSDSYGGGADIVGKTVTLTASGNFGLGSNANPLELNAINLITDTSAGLPAGGAQFLAEADGVAIGLNGLNPGSSSVNLESLGAAIYTFSSGDAINNLARLNLADGVQVALGADETLGALGDYPGHVASAAFANFNIAGRTLSVGANGNDTSYSGIFTGVGGRLVKLGVGRFTEIDGGVNTYTGLTTVQNGALVLSKSGGGNKAIVGPITIGDSIGAGGSAVLEIGANEQIADAAAIAFTGIDGRLLSTSGTTETITTPTDFAQGDVKVAGLLITNNAYAQNSGTTTLSGGVLRVGAVGTLNSSLGSSSTPGGKLQGSGTIYTNILTSWGTIDPSSGVTDADVGNVSPGRVNIRGNLQMTAASITNLDVGAAGSDQLNVGINTALTLPVGSYTVLSNYDLDPYLRGDVASVTEQTRRGVNDVNNVNGTVRFNGTLNTRPMAGSPPLADNASYGNSMNFVWRALDLPIGAVLGDLNPKAGTLSSLPSEFATKNSLDVNGVLVTTGTRFDSRFMGSASQLNAVGQSVNVMTKVAGVDTAVLTAPAYVVGQAKSLTLTSLTSVGIVDTTVVKVTKQVWNAMKDSHTRVTLTVTNTGAAPLTGPFYVELTALPAGSIVFNPAGKRPSTNRPYLVVPATSLAAGAAVTIEVDLLTPLSLAKTAAITAQIVRGGMA